MRPCRKCDRTDVPGLSLAVRVCDHCWRRPYLWRREIYGPHDMRRRRIGRIRPAPRLFPLTAPNVLILRKARAL